MTPSPRETVLCRYHYDSLHRLTSHALADTPERQRFYCKSRLATEIQGAMRYSIVQQGDQLLAQQRSEGDAPDTTLLATDHQRSVLQTVKANHPPQSIAYSPYGHRHVENGLLSLLGFNGERPDPVTGYYLLGNGYRAFNPVLMRFNNPDNLSPFGKGGLNTYAYCAGDPINWADPTGHSLVSQVVKSIGNNLSPETIIALQKTKNTLGKKLNIIMQSQQFETTPDIFLLENTINNSIKKIGKSLNQFENPNTIISHKGQLQTLEHLARTKTTKHSTIIFQLAYSPSHKISEHTRSAASKAFQKIDQFNAGRERLTASRIQRFERDGVIDYTSGSPPNYYDALSQREINSPNSANNNIRK
jgi:RHS repeat-associated protein